MAAASIFVIVGLINHKGSVYNLKCKAITDRGLGEIRGHFQRSNYNFQSPKVNITVRQAFHICNVSYTHYINYVSSYIKVRRFTSFPQGMPRDLIFYLEQKHPLLSQNVFSNIWEKRQIFSA